LHTNPAGFPHRSAGFDYSKMCAGEQHGRRQGNARSGLGESA
jgi:hypothetical protein